MSHRTSTDVCEREDRFVDLNPSQLNSAEKQSLVALALGILKQRHRAGRVLSSPEQTQAFLRLKLIDRKHEVFGALFLDLCAAEAYVQ